MSRHLKNIVLDALRAKGFSLVHFSHGSSAPHARGVYYFLLPKGMERISGAIDFPIKGRAGKKKIRIIIRPSRHRPGLHEVYVLHFPKQWSEACQANRKLIKLAQQQAHAIERLAREDAAEWWERFEAQLANPAPGTKRYAHFFTFVYVTLYRELRAADQRGVSVRLAKPAGIYRHSGACRTRFFPAIVPAIRLFHTIPRIRYPVPA